MTRIMGLIAWSLLTRAVYSADSMMDNPHPRLLLDAPGRDDLRARSLTPLYAPIREAVLRPSETSDIERVTGHDLMYAREPRHWAAAYLITGEARYAAQAAAVARRMVEDGFFRSTRTKGLTRAFAAVSVALAYDFCHAGWDEPTRRLISARLFESAQGMLRSMGAEANTGLANNWQAVRYGASGLAALACDEPGARELAVTAYRNLLAHLDANLGAEGWNPEGIGYTIYPWQFTGPFGIAAQRAGLGDLRRDLPRVARTLWTQYAGTVPLVQRAGRLGLRADFSDDHPAWSGEGVAGLTFWYTPTQHLPAVRWMYDRLCGTRGDRSYDGDRGGALYSLLYYPDLPEPVNPEEIHGLNYSDRSHGVALFRDRFDGERDIVAAVNAHARQPRGCHGGADANSLRIIGLGGCFAVGSGRTGHTGGQTTLFAGPPPARPSGLGRMHDVVFASDGSGIAAIEGSCTGVRGHRRVFAADYSGRAGAPAVFVNLESSENGRLWRFNTPEFNAFETDDAGFTVISPNGARLRVWVLEPRAKTYRQGTFLRGQQDRRDGGYPYRGKRYDHNRWIEFDCDGTVVTVMTLWDVSKPPPAPALEGEAATLRQAVAGWRLQASSSPAVPLRVGAQVYTVTEGGVRFMPSDGGAELTLTGRGAGVTPDVAEDLRPLIAAGDLDSLRVLRADDPRLVQADAQGWTLLHQAAWHGRDEIAAWLIAHGLGADALDARGLSPLHLAAQQGHTGTVAVLVAAGASASRADRQGLTPLHLALRQTALPAVVRQLLAAGADPMARDTAGRTALDTARLRRLGPEVMTLLQAAQPSGPAAEATAAMASPPDQATVSTADPATVAARGDLAALRALLDGGASVDAINNGWTPLHFAAQNGHTEVLRLLIARGADIEARNTGRAAPLFLACLRGREEAARLLLDAGARLDAVNASGATPLYAATQAGAVGLVKELLRRGADVNQGNRDGWTPLHLAGQNGSLELVEVLIEAGADVNRAENGGWTALHLAAQDNRGAVIERLLAADASVALRDQAGKTPLDIATTHRHADAIERLTGQE